MSATGSLSKPHQQMLAGHANAITRRTGAGALDVGRAPWYDSEECSVKSPLIIGVTGGTASGKTTVCSRVKSRLQTPWVSLISMDSFYRPLTADERAQANAGAYNFDGPMAVDWDLFLAVLKDIKLGKSVQIPEYCFRTHSRLAKSHQIYGSDVVIVEGILALWNEQVRSMFDIKIFVDADSDLRLARRLKRDILERGRTVDNVLAQYQRTVKPSFDSFIHPTKAFADIIIPFSNENPVAIDMLSQHVASRLTVREHEFRAERETAAASVAVAAVAVAAPRAATVSAAQTAFLLMSPASAPASAANVEIPQNCHVMRQTRALRALHTILRDRQCPPDEFVYQCDRLGRLVVEYGLAHLPFAPAIVTTPTGLPFAGAAFAAAGADLCGVSIVRGGEAMEIALREVVRDVRIGKIVIQQSAEKMNGPRLYYSKLPPDVAQRRVLLMDPVLGTAQTAKMAVRVLLDHGVPEDRIVFLALIVSAAGARSLAQTFPRVQLITSAVDSQAARGDSQFAVPGLGCFGERYYHQERTAAGSHDDAADAVTSSA